MFPCFLYSFAVFVSLLFTTYPGTAQEPSAGLGSYTPAEVPNSVAGLQSQIDELVRIAKTHNQTNWRIALDTFSLTNADAWFQANFSPMHAAQLSQDYPKFRDGHLGHVSWVIGHNQEAPGFGIGVAPSEMPAPISDSGFESLLPRPLHSIALQNFRLTPTANSGSMPPSWVSSFVYVDGHFRVIGGTYPFWAEKLNSVRGPMSFRAVVMNGLTVQGAAYRHDQVGNGIVAIVQLKVDAGRGGHAKRIKVLSGDEPYIEQAKEYIQNADFPTLPDDPRFANARLEWEIEVAFFAPKNQT